MSVYILLYTFYLIQFRSVNCLNIDLSVYLSFRHARYFTTLQLYKVCGELVLTSIAEPIKSQHVKLLQCNSGVINIRAVEALMHAVDLCRCCCSEDVKSTTVI